MGGRASAGCPAGIACGYCLRHAEDLAQVSAGLRWARQGCAVGSAGRASQLPACRRLPRPACTPPRCLAPMQPHVACPVHPHMNLHRCRSTIRRPVPALQSRMVAGLAAPLAYVAALSTAVALYHTGAEAGLAPAVPLDLQVSRVGAGQCCRRAGAGGRGWRGRRRSTCGRGLLGRRVEGRRAAWEGSGLRLLAAAGTGSMVRLAPPCSPHHTQQIRSPQPFSHSSLLDQRPSAGPPHAALTTHNRSAAPTPSRSPPLRSRCCWSSGGFDGPALQGWLAALLLLMVLLPLAGAAAAVPGSGPPPPARPPRPPTASKPPSAAWSARQAGSLGACHGRPTAAVCTGLPPCRTSASYSHWHFWAIRGRNPKPRPSTLSLLHTAGPTPPTRAGPCASGWA